MFPSHRGPCHCCLKLGHLPPTLVLVCEDGSPSTGVCPYVRDWTYMFVSLSPFPARPLPRTPGGTRWKEVHVGRDIGVSGQDPCGRTGKGPFFWLSSLDPSLTLSSGCTDYGFRYERDTDLVSGLPRSVPLHLTPQCPVATGSLCPSERVAKMGRGSHDYWGCRPDTWTVAVQQTEDSQS